MDVMLAALGHFARALFLAPLAVLAVAPPPPPAAPGKSPRRYLLPLLVLLGGGLLLAYQSGLFYRSSVPELTTAAQLDEALGTEELVVIDLYSPTCGPCRELAPLLDDLHKAWSADVRFYKINAAAHPSLAGRFDVTAVPLLVFYRDGQEVGRLLGLKTRDELNRALALHTGRPVPPGAAGQADPPKG